MPLFRSVTETPLTRLFAQDVDGRSTQKRIDVPWDAFSAKAFPDSALEVGYDAMRWLASGEYTAVEGFARLVVGFSWHGVPYDLIAACARIPGDEIRHSEIALQAAARLSGKRSVDIPLAIDGRRPKRPADVRAPLSDIDLQVAILPAFLETIAASLLTEARRRATDPMMKAVYASILSDEIHHARLGWYYLAWRAPQWTKAERQRVADAVGAQITGRVAQISDGRPASPGAKRALAALGVMDSATQARVVKRAMEDEIVPGFDALGLGASHAYARSPLSKSTRGKRT
jgi:hypothetical protein